MPADEATEIVRGGLEGLAGVVEDDARAPVGLPSPVRERVAAQVDR